MGQHLSRCASVCCGPVRGSGQILLLLGLGAALVLAFVFKNYDVGFDSRLYILTVGILLGLTAKFWRVPLPFAAIMASSLGLHSHIPYLRKPPVRASPVPVASSRSTRST